MADEVKEAILEKPKTEEQLRAELENSWADPNDNRPAGMQQIEATFQGQVRDKGEGDEQFDPGKWVTIHPKPKTSDSD